VCKCSLAVGSVHSRQSQQRLGQLCERPATEYYMRGKISRVVNVGWRRNWAPVLNGLLAVDFLSKQRGVEASRLYRRQYWPVRVCGDSSTLNAQVRKVTVP
jgi:hypothetical protein